jgi:hypothetical protein
VKRALARLQDLDPQLYAELSRPNATGDRTRAALAWLVAFTNYAVEAASGLKEARCAAQ